MNLRELVDHVRTGPALLVLDKPLSFRRGTRSNPCDHDFNEFLQALQSSETIRSAHCRSHRQLGITEGGWVLIVEALGRIKGIGNLTIWCSHGSRDFRPFRAIAEALKSAHSLCKPTVLLTGRYFIEIQLDKLHLPMLFESTQPCRNSLGILFVLGQRQHRGSFPPPRPCAPGIASVSPPPESGHHDRLGRYWCHEKAATTVGPGHRRNFKIEYRTMVRCDRRDSPGPLQYQTPPP
jgi:hypothetical protein